MLDKYAERIEVDGTGWDRAQWRAISAALNPRILLRLNLLSV